MPRNEVSAQNGSQWTTAYKEHTVTKLFRTLRDMAEGMTIDFEELEFVRNLGGALQNCRYTPVIALQRRQFNPVTQQAVPRCLGSIDPKNRF